MLFLRMTCPPMPHYVISGQCIFRPGDKHSKRTIKNVFDMIYVRQGCLYLTQNGTGYEVHEGQYIILYPDTTHKGYKVCSEETVFEWVHFHAAGGYKLTKEQELEDLNKKGNPNVYYNKQSFFVQLPLFGEVPEDERQTVLAYFEELRMVVQDNYQHTKRYLTQKSGDYAQQLIFLNLLKILSQRYTSDKSSPVKKLHRFIEQNYKDDISIAKAAESLSYSTSHLIRLFLKDYGISPKQYITVLRITDAKDLLINTSLSVNEISEREGFGTSSQFIFQFRKITGETPLQYRRSHT